MSADMSAGQPPASANFDELGESHIGAAEIPLSHLMDLTLPVSI